MRIELLHHCLNATLAERIVAKMRTIYPSDNFHSFENGIFWENTSSDEEWCQALAMYAAGYEAALIDLGIA